MAKDNGNNNDNGNKPQRPGFFASVGKAVREISAEIKKDLQNSPPPGAGKGQEFTAPEHLAKTVASAQAGVAFREDPGVPGVSASQHTPQTLTLPAKALNPWPELRQPGSYKKYLTDAYYHAYTPADIAHYLSSMPQGLTTISLLSTEAGDTLLRQSFEDTLRNTPALFGATGFSPRNLQPSVEDLDTALTDILNANPKLLAVGPIGLDLTYTSHNLVQQSEQMARQLEIAHEFGLPALIFQNGAISELRDLLEQGLSLPKKMIWLKPIQEAPELELIQEYDLYVALRAELTWPKETFYREAIGQVLPRRWLVGAGNSLKTTHNRAGHFNSAAGLEDIIQTMAELLKVDVKDLRDRLNMNFAHVYGPEEA